MNAIEELMKEIRAELSVATPESADRYDEIHVQHMYCAKTLTDLALRLMRAAKGDST